MLSKLWFSIVMIMTCFTGVLVPEVTACEKATGTSTTGRQRITAASADTSVRPKCSTCAVSIPFHVFNVPSKQQTLYYVFPISSVLEKTCDEQRAAAYQSSENDERHITIKHYQVCRKKYD